MTRRSVVGVALTGAAGVLVGGAVIAMAQDGGTRVIAEDALLVTPLAGVENTKATREVVEVSGSSFSKVLKITLAEAGKDTNATQLLIPITAPVEAGDGLVASISLRGVAKAGGPARIILMFEKATNPWTKSVTQTVVAAGDSTQWKRVLIPFTASESYKPGEAMLSVRLATQVQTVELGGLELLNYGKVTDPDTFLNSAYGRAPVVKAAVTVDLGKERQIMQGFGGNFCKGRFGMSEMNDSVGRYTLENLNVRHARVGIPLQFWQDGPGQPYNDSGPNHGTFQLMQEMKRREIPMVASIWDAPKWMLSNPERDAQRIIPKERWDDSIEAIKQWLITARDKYNVTVDYISFNEADGGYQIKFTSAEITAYIKQAQLKFAAAGLKVKWLAGDTANGSGLVRYTRPLLADPELAPHLGPISFHSWDALNVSPETYRAIAALGKEFNRPIWCLEMGHDAQLWRARPPVWHTWDNALRLATAYVRTIRDSEASVLDYWEYQADYPLADGDKQQPFPALNVIKQMEAALPPGVKVVETSESGNDALTVIAAKNATGKGVALILLNNGGPAEVTLSGLPAGIALKPIRSDSKEQLKAGQETLAVDPKGAVTISVGARSMVTVRGE